MEEMKPGLELDRMIAEKVMGWKNVKVVTASGTGLGQLQGEMPKDGIYHTRKVPEFSRDIAAAWEVVEKIKDIRVKDGKEESWMFSVTFEQDTKKWLAGYQYVYCDHSTNWINGAIAETPALAICLAALKAVAGC